MVADFGIALAVSAAAGGRMTETGMSLGTPHYMSPEQATADKDLTSRSDIYSLGSVLYEMLTGEPPHVGGSAQAVIMKIVTDDARPVTELRKTVPPHVAAATARSLEKVPADRFESASKFAEALTNPAYAPSVVVSSAAIAATTPDWKGRMALPLAALSAVLLLFVGWGWLGGAPSDADPVIRYVVGFDDVTTPQPFYGPSFALSPDGSLMAYAGASERGSQLWIQRRDAFAPESIPGTDAIWQPDFSPDGQRVAFITGARELKIVSLTGEPPITLADSGMWRNGISWGYDGYVYAGFQQLPTVVGRIPVGGGAAEQITTLDTLDGEVSHSWFDALPNGKGVLFTVMRLTNQASQDDAIAVVDLETGEHHDLVQGILGRYVDGYLLYVRFDGALVAAPFDQDKLEITGPSVPLVAGMPVISGPDVALSASGRLAYAPTGSAPGLAEVVWLDRQGLVTPYEQGWILNPNLASGPELSPDGSKLAVSVVAAGVGDVYVKDGVGGPFTRLTFDGNSIRPSWTPDGQYVSYRSVSPGLSYDVFRQRADGSGSPEVFVDLEQNISSATWSDDGEWLLVAIETPPDVYAIRSGDSTAIPLLTDDAREGAPTLSPNGRWLAYVSDESGRPEIYVRSFPNVMDSKQQVSTDGGVEPRWAHSGRELFFKSSAREFIAVSVTTGDRFAVEGRETLFVASAAVGPFAKLSGLCRRPG